jgi:hypothetical protein
MRAPAQRRLAPECTLPVLRLERLPELARRHPRPSSTATRPGGSRRTSSRGFRLAAPLRGLPCSAELLEEPGRARARAAAASRGRHARRSRPRAPVASRSGKGRTRRSARRSDTAFRLGASRRRSRRRRFGLLRRLGFSRPVPFDDQGDVAVLHAPGSRHCALAKLREGVLPPRLRGTQRRESFVEVAPRADRALQWALPAPTELRDHVTDAAAGSAAGGASA